MLGNVLDASRAAIPNVTVTAQNEETGAVATAISEYTGSFDFPMLPPGKYTITCKQPGFRRFVARNVQVAPSASVLLTVVLTAGELRDSVEVRAPFQGAFGAHGKEDSFAPITTGDRTAVVTVSEIRNLSIVGRNATELIKALPGMAIWTANVENRYAYAGDVAGINGPVGSYSGNGTQPGAMDLISEGAHLIDPGCNCSAAINVNSNMVEEFRVQTSNFGAEYPKGPVVISIIGKSGGRNLHGETYLYARHYALNSTDWMVGHDGLKKPEDRHYYPGFNLGGPVLIPHTSFNKNRDRLFFFTGFEYYQQVLGHSSPRTFVPTAEMLNGNFSQASLDALGPGIGGGWNRQPAGYAGGQIPKSMMDPGGLALARALPQPNVDPATHDGANYVAVLPQDQNGWQVRTRIDYRVSDSARLYVSFNRQKEFLEAPITLWWTPQDAVPYPSPVEGAHRSDSVSANLVKAFGPSMMNEVVFTYTDLDSPYRLANPSRADRVSLGYPYQGVFKNGARQIPSFTSWGNGVPSVIMPGGFDSGSMVSRKRMPTFADNLTKVTGAHTLKFGFYTEVTGNQQLSSNNNQGFLTFGSSHPNSTKNTVADFLLGRVAAYSEANVSPIYDMSYRSLDFYAQDSWRASSKLTVQYGIRLSHLGPWRDNNGIGFATWDPSRYSDDPSKMGDLTGLAWRAWDSRVPDSAVTGRMVFASPHFGMAYDLFGTGKTVLRGGWGAYRYHDPYNQYAGALNVGLGVRSYDTPGDTTLAGIDSVQIPVARTGFQALYPHDDQQPLTYSYSFTVSQRLPDRSLFEAAYVGNRSEHLLREGSLANGNSVPMGALLATPNPDSADSDQFRPYRNYQQFTLLRHDAYQNYNGVQATWARQHGRVNYNLNYTFSKAMGVRGGAQGTVADPANLRNNYGPLSYDRTHIFNATYSIELGAPVRAGRLWKGVANGWQISGITQLQSGVNLQAAGSSNFGLMGYLADGTALTNRRLLGTPDLPLQPRLVCDPRTGLRENQFINPSCFAPPAAGQNGDYIFPYLRGPAFFNSDLSLFKNFKLSEKKTLQFRVSAFNFLNHPLRSFLGSGESNLTLEYNAQGLARPDFGVATHKYGRRLMQLAVKFDF